MAKDFAKTFIPRGLKRCSTRQFLLWIAPWLAVAIATAVIYPLKSLAPAASLSVVYLLAVLLVSSLWGMLPGLATSLLSAALALVGELLDNNGTPSRELVKRVESELGRAQLIELMIVAGYYAMLGGVMRAVRIDVVASGGEYPGLGVDRGRIGAAVSADGIGTIEAIRFDGFRCDSVHEEPVLATLDRPSSVLPKRSS